MTSTMGLGQVYWDHVPSDENPTRPTAWTQLTNTLLPMCEKHAPFVNTVRIRQKWTDHASMQFVHPKKI